MSVRLRLTLLNMVVFALALGIFGGMVRALVEHNLIAGVDRQLKRERPGRPPRRTNNEGTTLTDLQESFAWFRMMDPEAPVWPFYLASGFNAFDDMTLPGDPEALKRCVADGKPLLTTHKGSRYYTEKITTKSGPALYRQRSESLETVHAELSRLTKTLLTTTPLALLIAGFGGMFLTGRALAPVRAATEAAARIGAEDLSERLPIRGRDEFARLASTFNGMLERLEAAFDRQKRFVSDASHELKTPLTVIKANTSLALAEPDLPTDYRETLVEIDRAADRTSRIVQDLLVLARTEKGRLPLQEAELSFLVLCEAVVQEARRLHPEGPTVALQVRNETLWGDRHLLHRLLLNLLDNALRYTPASGSVTITPIANGFVVTDTGEGIAPEHLPHLGERFYRVDAARARKDGGTGLGLAISRTIAEAHGGTLTIQSEKGKGTTVTVKLAGAAG